jgi:hypothetical protein
MRSSPQVAAPSDSLAQFTGSSEAVNIDSSGDEAITPPDPDIATGPEDVVETANSVMYVYNRSGAVLGWVDLNDFLNLDPDFDQSMSPRIIYDPGSQRFWLVSEVVPVNASCSSAASPVLVAVSGSSNPLPFTSWLVYQLPYETAGTLVGREPGLGVSSSTLAVSFDDIDCNGNFLGSDIDILQKTDYEDNTGDSSIVPFTDPDESELVPVQSYGTTTTQYVITNDSDCGSTACVNPEVVVDAFHGTPEPSGNVSVVETTPAMAPTDENSSGLPPALEKGTSNGLITGDDRFENAVWENGVIWTGGGTMCTPAGDTTPRSCLDYVAITASSTGVVNPTITQINNVGVDGAYLFYPGVSVDSSGDMITVFDESSASTYTSIVDAVAPSGSSSLSGFETLHTSSGFYDPSTNNPGACQMFGALKACTWGDDSGVTQDPSHPTDVWAVSEAEDETITTGCNVAQLCWGTDISDITVATPSLTSLSPASGPVAGGQTVTVTGTDFGLDTTATLNGGALTISNLTPTSFTFVTPPGPDAGATVMVQATDAIGSTANVPYTYIGLANYFPVTPFRLLDTRSTGGPLGPGAIRALKVTGGAIPASATAAVLNVTEVSGSASSLLTVFPYGTSRPNASNLNFAAHTVIANLVTVTLGANGGAGWINIYNALGSVNVLVDVEGYFAPEPASTLQGLFHPVSPIRVCDTRHPSPTPICSAHGPLGPGAYMVVNFANAGGLPADGSAEAAVVNLTGVAGTASTYLSLAPTNSSGGCSFTGTSTINLAPGAVEANRVMVALGPSVPSGVDDSLCVFNAAGKIDVVIDANGWYGSAQASASPAGFQYQALAPTRICDTRVLSLSCSSGVIPPTRLITVGGHAGVPAFGSATTVVAIVANLTAIAPTATTYLTVYPANVSKPNASDLNVNAGVVLPNLVVVELDTSGDGLSGDVDLYNSAGAINAILDLEGWFQ